MENISGGSLKRQLPAAKQIKRSNGGSRTTSNADCSRNWSAKISLMFFFLAYVSLGAYVFMLIEASSSAASSTMNQFTPPTKEIRTALSGATSTSSSSEQQQQQQPTTTTAANNNEAGDVTQMKELMTRQVLDKLWDITENLNILYKENWTRLAAGEIYRFHETMYLWMKNDCNNNRRKSSQQEMTAVQHQTTTTATSPAGAGTGQHHRHKTVKWNYPTAFLYALSVITTLGSCPVIPESNEGKILTILFAAFGIPLLLFYLTVVGSALSSCLMCCPLLDSSSSRKHESMAMRRRRRSDHPSTSGLHMSAVMTTSHHQQPANELLFHNHHHHHHQHSMKSSVIVKDDESIEAMSSTSSSSDYNRMMSRIRSFWPPVFCLILILFFVACGTFLFSFLMSLPAMDALLLSFMLLTTTGIPDVHSSVWSGQSSWPLVAVSVYIFLALTLCSICFNLIYEWLLAQWTLSSASNPCDPSGAENDTRHRSGSFHS